MPPSIRGVPPTERVVPERVRAIAATVRRLRRSRGWRQLDLAAQLGISQSRLSELESCDGSFSAEHLIAMLSIFGTTVEEFTLRPKPKPAPIGDPTLAIIAALEEWTTSAVLAAAPRMIHEIDRVALPTIEDEMIMQEHRLRWFIEMVRAAIEGDERDRHADDVLAEFMRTARELNRALPRIEALDGPHGPAAMDRFWASSTSISKRWSVASRLTPEDFAARIEAGR